MSVSPSSILSNQVFQAPRDLTSQNSGYLSRAINRHLAGWEVTSIQMVEVGFFLFNCFFISYLDTRLGCTSRVFSVIKPQNYSWLVQKVIRWTVYPVVYSILGKGVDLISSPITRSVTKPVRDLKIEKMRRALDSLLQQYEEKGGAIKTLSVEDIDKIHAEVEDQKAEDLNYDAKEDEVDVAPLQAEVPSYRGPLNKIRPTDMSSDVMTGIDRNSRKFVVFRVSNKDEGTPRYSLTIVLDDKTGCKAYFISAKEQSDQLHIPSDFREAATGGIFNHLINDLSKMIKTSSDGCLYHRQEEKLAIQISPYEKSSSAFTKYTFDKSNENSGYLTRLIDGRLSTWRIDKLRSVRTSLLIFKLFSISFLYFFSVRPRFNATWLRDRSSLLSIPVHLFIHTILQKTVTRAINMILVKSTVRKMKTVLDEIVEKCTKKGIPVGEFQAGALHDIHIDSTHISYPLTLGVDRKGRAAQVLCLKEGEEDPFILTVSLSLLDYQVYASDKGHKDLTGLSFEALAGKLKNIVEGADNTYILYDPKR